MPHSLARRFADPPLARLAIACGVLLSLAVRAVASPPFREGRVLVGYVDGVAGGRHARIASVVGATDVGAIGAHTRVLRVRPGREMATIHALRARHDVRYAEPDWIGHADALPDDPKFGPVGKQVIAQVDGTSRDEPVYVAARSFPLWIFYTTDWNAPDEDRLRWAATIARAGGPAHNNAPSRGRVRPDEARDLSRRYRGRLELVGTPTGRQYRTSTRTLDPSLPFAKYALPLEPDTGWAELEVSRLASAAHNRIWVFGSHMFALDGAEPALVGEMQRRGVRLIMQRRQGTTVAYEVEFPGEP